MKKHLPYTLAILISLLAVIYLAITATSRTDHLKKTSNPFQKPPLSYLPPHLIPIVTLGHKHVYEDFISLWLLQAMMDETLPFEPNKMMGLIQSVLQHSPRLETNYLLACITMFDLFQEPQECQQIALSGLKAIPNSWRIPMLQGYIHAELLEEPAQAAAFFKMAASRPNKPDWVGRLVEKLITSPDLAKDDLQRSLQLLLSTPNSQEHAGVIRKLRESQSRP